MKEVASDLPPAAAAPVGRIRRWDTTGVPLLLARLAVGGTFAVLALAKLGEPVAFLKLVRQYGLLPEEPPVVLNVVAVTLPWIELACALLLLAGVALRGAAAVSAGLLAVFTYAIAHRGLQLAAEAGSSLCAVAFDCGCGSGVVPVCPKLLQNLLLLALAGVVVWSRSRRWCLQRR